MFPLIENTNGTFRVNGELLIGRWYDVSGKTIDIFQKTVWGNCLQCRMKSETIFDMIEDHIQCLRHVIYSNNKPGMNWNWY